MQRLTEKGTAVNMTNVTGAEARELFDNFFTINIENNGSLEALGNHLMKPVRTSLTLNGREVTQFTGNSTYKLVDENDWAWFPDESTAPLRAVILCTIAAVAIIAGAIIKAISWLVIAETFNRNLAFARVRMQERTRLQENDITESTLAADLARRLFEVQETERLRNQHGPTVSQENSVAGNGADIQINLESLPLEVLARIANFVGGTDNDHPDGNFTNLTTLRRTSRRWAVVVNLREVGFATRAIDQRNAFIRQHFSQELIDIVNGDNPNRWAKAPRIRLLAHRVTSENEEYISLQSYNNPRLRSSLNFIDVSEMGDHAICWGLDPLPFLAIRVNYMTAWWNTGNPPRDEMVNQEGVFTIHPVLQVASYSISSQRFMFPDIHQWMISCSDMSMQRKFTVQIGDQLRQFLNGETSTFAVRKFEEIHTYNGSLFPS